MRALFPLLLTAGCLPEGGGEKPAEDDCPVVSIDRTALSFSGVEPGDEASDDLALSNACAGEAALNLSGSLSGSGAFSLPLDAVSVAPGEVIRFEVRWGPTDTTPDAGTLLLSTNDPSRPEIAVTLSGLPLTDLDGDGYAEGEDCDDADADISPDAEEIWYDGTDQDCDEQSDFDQDRDGHDSQDYGGVDCDDTDASINPEASEIWYDGVDQDCDGQSDLDQDGDGYAHDGYGGEDCDDTNAAVYPSAEDAWYDGVDSDCDGADDLDADGDGHRASAYGGDDCDDGDPETWPGAEERWYDGADQDCDGASDYDQDGDGEDSDTYGGPDCDDTDARVNRGATETWYDGVDSDCDGASDYDQDGDGEDSDTYGGPDCDDTDPATSSGTAELDNGRDDDCDVLVDEDFLAPGDIVITEVMPSPDAVSDTLGEWFELYNNSGRLIDLVGWTVYSDDGGEFLISGSLPVADGAYVVLGVEDDPTLNGGVAVDYVYDRTDYGLADSGDSIYLIAGARTMAELAWTSAWDAAGTPGRAMRLDDDHYALADAGDADVWCVAEAPLSGGDYGAPGEGDGDCWLDDDGDGESLFDCDDDDPAVFPTATELSNGLDDDCNGLIDETVIDPTSGPWLGGTAASQYMNLLGVADLDGDGALELATWLNSSSVCYILADGSYAGWAGSGPGYYDETLFSTTSAGRTLMAVPAEQRDLTGDGQADLIWANAPSSVPGFVIYAGPFTKSSGSEPPDVSFSRAETAASSGMAVDVSGDLDGDGVVEVLYANPSSNVGGSGKQGAVAILESAALSGGIGYNEASLVLTGTSGYGGGARLIDLNGDGYDDVAAGAQSADTFYVFLSDAFATSGLTSVSSVAEATISGLNGSRWVVDDVDGDGAPDLASADGDAEVIWLLDLGSLSGGVTASPDATYTLPQYGGSGAWSELLPTRVPWDVDGDGDVESALYASGDFSDPLLLWFSPAAFADGVVTGDEAATALALPGLQGVVRGFAADLDGSGDEELVIGDYRWSGAFTLAGAAFVVDP